MNNVRIFLVVLLLVVLTCHIVAVADSLLKESNGLCNIYRGKIANRVGDVITIIFDEKTVSNQTGKGKLKNTYSTGADKGRGLLEQFLGVGLSGGDTVEVETNTVQRNSLTATMSATVKEILPNGNMRIEGYKSLEINHETQKLTITGIIRSLDVGSNNTIGSSKVANLKARVNGLPIQRSVKKPRGGIVRWVLNLLF